jgi:hypothetical protein
MKRQRVDRVAGGMAKMAKNVMAAAAGGKSISIGGISK